MEWITLPRQCAKRTVQAGLARLRRGGNHELAFALRELLLEVRDHVRAEVN